MSEGGWRRGCLIVVGSFGMLLLALVSMLISVCGGGLFGPNSNTAFDFLIIALLTAIGISLIWVLAVATSPRRKSDDKPENRP